MNLLIDTKGRKALIAVTERTGALIEALSDVMLIDERYEGGRYVYKPAGTEETPETIDISFVSESILSAPTPMIDELTASMKRSEKRWLEEYTKRTSLEKRTKRTEGKGCFVDVPGGIRMKYTHHTVRHVLSDGTEILYNRIQGKSVEDHASMCLRPMTDRERRESDQIDLDDDVAFAEECELEKAASVAQTDLW